MTLPECLVHDLSGLTGTGPEGMIVADDVETLLTPAANSFRFAWQRMPP